MATPSSAIELQKKPWPEAKEDAVYRNGRYDIFNKPRGYCILITVTRDLEDAEIDEKKMEALFGELSFEVKKIRDKSHKEINEELTELASSMPVAHQCVIVFINSHGGEKKSRHFFQDTNGDNLYSSYILDSFNGTNCPTLRGRPKVFIVDTCFGNQPMEGIVTKSRPFEYKARREGDGDIVVADKRSDFLIYNASLSGHPSHIQKETGSVMIDQIDKVLREHAKDEHLKDLFTRVNNKVARQGADTGLWQQPTMKDDSLNFSLYLNPGYCKIEVPTPVLLDQAPVSMEHKDVLSTIDEKNLSAMWRCQQEDCVMVGSKNTIIQIDHKNDNWTKYKLSVGTPIQAGLAIDTDTHIIAVREGNNDYTLLAVHINPLANLEPLIPFKQIKLDSNVGPIDMFLMQETQFGVYYAARSSVDVFKLEDVFVKALPVPEKSIALSNNTLHRSGKICEDVQGKLFVASSYMGKNKGNVYEKDGTFVQEITNELEGPIALQGYDNGGIIAICAKGKLHVYTPGEGEGNERYKSGSWEKLNGQAKQPTVCEAVQTKSFLWTLECDVDKLINIHRYRLNYTRP